MQCAGHMDAMREIEDDFSKDFLASNLLSSKTRRQAISLSGYVIENYIHDIVIEKQVANGSPAIEINAKCYRSQRKSEKPHVVMLHIDTSRNAIVDSLCSCTAGLVIK